MIFKAYLGTFSKVYEIYPTDLRLDEKLKQKTKRGHGEQVDDDQKVLQKEIELFSHQMKD
jgi:hypothetical protein